MPRSVKEEAAVRAKKEKLEADTESGEEEEEEEGEEEEGEEEERTPNKRARVKKQKQQQKKKKNKGPKAEMSSSDEEEEEDSPPKRRKKKAAVALPRQDPTLPAPDPVRLDDKDLPSFRPGAIVRVTLHNFLTYTDAEVRPEPGLNVILGPNGSGKSSIVCAILLGLAGKTSSLLRAENVGEYVKSGEESGWVELELFRARGGRNAVVRRRLKRDDKRSSNYLINGERATERDVFAMCKEHGIQVDNLCSFLAQERVVKFAGLNPRELLSEALMVVDPKLHETLAELSELRKKEKSSEDRLAEEVAKLDGLQRAQEAVRKQVERHEQREEALHHIEVLGKKKLWLDFDERRKEALLLREAKVAAEQKLKESEEHLEPLRRRLEGTRAAHDRLTGEQKKAEDAARRARNAHSKSVDELRGEEENLVALRDELAERRREAADVERRRARAEKEVSSLQAKLDALADQAELDRRREELDARERDLKESLSRPKARMQKFRDSFRELQSQDAELDRRIRSRGDARTRLRRDADRFTRGAFSASTQFFEKEGMLEDGSVVGPLYECVRVANPLHAQYLETLMTAGDRCSYVHVRGEDRRQYAAIMRHFKAKRVSQGVHQARGGRVQLPGRPRGAVFEQYGGEYLTSSAEASEPVMRLLCEKWQLDRVVALERVPPPEVLEQMLTRRKGDGLPRIVMTPEGYHSRTLNEYTGNHSTQFQQLRDLHFFAPSAAGEEEELRAMRADQQQLRDRMQAMQDEGKEIKAEQTRVQEEIRVVRNERGDLGGELKRRTALESRVAAAEREAKRLAKGVDLEAAKARYRAGVAAVNAKRLRAAKRMADAVESRLRTARDLDGVVLQREVLSRVARALDADIRQVEGASEELRRAAEAAAVRAGAAKQTAKKAKAVAERDAPMDEWKDRMKGLEETTLAAVERAIRVNEAQVSAFEVDANLVEQFERRRAQIETLQRSVSEYRVDHERDGARIEVLRREWLPRVQENVNVLNSAFADSFHDIGCLGEIRLEQHEDFDKWELQIWVSYRENVKAKKLDAHSQSGGERSVATMLFLLCLQNVTQTPFRVVDEINQGMDPKNERMVFEKIVAGSQACQFFLVSPKLLPNLAYSDGIAVHFVHNGPHLPLQKEWDFDAFCERAAKKAGRDFKSARAAVLRT